MASSVDISNLALANLGDDASVSSINPPDGSIQAAHCSRFYPIALDQLLEMHAWSFATTRVQLAETGTAPDEWAYQYAYPTNSVKILKILPDGAASDDESVDFQVESLTDGTRVILTNEPLAWATYVYKQYDTSKFTPLFVVALSWLLTYHLCGPITKDLQKKEAAMKTFMLEFGRAAASDANSGRRDHRKNYTPASIKAR